MVEHEGCEEHAKQWVGHIEYQQIEKSILQTFHVFYLLLFVMFFCMRGVRPLPNDLISLNKIGLRYQATHNMARWLEIRDAQHASDACKAVFADQEKYVAE